MSSLAVPEAGQDVALNPMSAPTVSGLVHAHYLLLFNVIVLSQEKPKPE